MPKKLFGAQIEIGVGRMDISTEDLVIDAPVAAERAKQMP